VQQQAGNSSATAGLAEAPGAETAARQKTAGARGRAKKRTKNYRKRPPEEAEQLGQTRAAGASSEMATQRVRATSGDSERSGREAERGAAGKEAQKNRRRRAAEVTAVHTSGPEREEEKEAQRIQRRVDEVTVIQTSEPAREEVPEVRGLLCGAAGGHLPRGGRTKVQEYLAKRQEDTPPKGRRTNFKDCLVERLVDTPAQRGRRTEKQARRRQQVQMDVAKCSASGACTQSGSQT